MTVRPLLAVLSPGLNGGHDGAKLSVDHRGLLLSDRASHGVDFD